MQAHKRRLADIPRKEPLPAPEGFFDTFLDDLEEALAQKEATQRPEAKVVTMPLRWACAAAASLALLLGLAWLLQKPEPQPLSAEALLNEVSSAEIVNYLALHQVELEHILHGVDPALLVNDEVGVLPAAKLSDDELDLIYDEYEYLF
ncbi:MAG: hypothetical protein HC842_01200 [Cytophagales bacterium]|nr:hypothetical protein [Cytophagales bacterium]